MTADVGDIEAALVGESDAYDISFDCGVGEATLNGENVKKNTQIHAADAYVEAGDVLGYVSEPTKYYSVEGSNLYFALRHGEETIDPITFFE